MTASFAVLTCSFSQDINVNKPIVIVTAHTALSVNVIYLEACGKNVDCCTSSKDDINEKGLKHKVELA